MSMVGRDRELALGARLLAPGGPWPRGLVLEGLPGIGKTTVLREIVRRAERAGLWRSRASPRRPR
jgi:MoxR-like ATPase